MTRYEMEKEKQRYLIAGISVRMDCAEDFMRRQCAAYEAHETDGAAGPEEDEACPDLTCTADDWEIYRLRFRQQGISRRDFEYAMTFQKFADQIIWRNGFCLHASAISADGKGILFSGDSGVGKSTQAGLWEKYMAGHGVIRINDDKPAIRITDGEPLVCGTPWCGKHLVNTNTCVPAKALIFLEQAQEDRLEELPAKGALPLVLPQILGGKGTQEQTALLMGMLDVFLRAVPIYRLRCTAGRSAVRLVYEELQRRM